MAKGLFVVISGPSGVGKGTIIELLKKRITNAVFVLSHTTRAKRPGEKDGEVYHFVSVDEFKKGIEEGKFLEWAQVHEKDYYGTMKEMVEKGLAEGRLVIREVDIQGAKSIKEIIPKDQLLMIFIKPENLTLLRARIEHRGKLPEEEMQRRMHSAELEIAEAKHFNYQITNYEGQVERCYMDVEGIIRSQAENRGIHLGGTGGTLV
jgi:guanylate kinase